MDVEKVNGSSSRCSNIHACRFTQRTASTGRVDRSKTLREGFCLTTKPNVLNKFINMLMYDESKQN